MASMPPPPPWTELPPDITAIILQKLGAVEALTRAQVVCKAWRSVCLDPATWRVVDMRLDVDMRFNLLLLPSDYSLKLHNLCCSAVDRSQGQMVCITLEFIASAGLLNYIADRTPWLRCLRLVSCCGISGEELSEVIKRLPRLEDLQFHDMKLTGEVIEAIGCSCPFLQSFGLNMKAPVRPQIDCDDEAFAIAKSMPSLHHLQLLGNRLTNEGLQAVLDCCPRLESLDLRQCYNIRLSGSVGRRCSEKIDLLKCPDYSIGESGVDASIEDFESSDEDHPLGISDIELMSVDDDYYEFSDTEYYESPTVNDQ